MRNSTAPSWSSAWSSNCGTRVSSRPGGCYTHKPLAIYVPRKYVQGEQLGRRRHKMEAIQQNHDEIAIDWNRNYAVIYEWLKGIDAAEACRQGLLDSETWLG